MLSPPTACSPTKGTICQMVSDLKLNGVNITEERRNPNSTIFKCCSGFCVDLIKKFANDLSFDFALKRVKDGKWGGIVNGSWNGLVAELINHETDLVMTSLKINSARESVIDFSVPFLETGITILVSKRTGIISPTAFLEPFDFYSWMSVVMVAVQVAAGSIFLFEWFSPSGYNMTDTHNQGNFSFARTLWLVWVVLFKAAVNVDCPQGYSARLMANVWALFALIFLAIYTANLAAFMITREEYFDLVGVQDSRLSNPQSLKPSFRFGTIPNGATDFVMKKNFPNMHMYMKAFNEPTVKEGAKAVKQNRLDAFIYDATVLEYLVGQDDECNMLTVGSWYAMTGYGIAFPKSSKWLPHFNEQLMIYRENGDLERLQRFWFTGACKPGERKKSSSKPLALAQFMSAFFLLGCGVCLSVVFLIIEHIYFKYLRKWSGKLFGGNRWFNLLSLSVGDSVKAENGKPQPERKHVCQNNECESMIEDTEAELSAAHKQIELLEKQLEKMDHLSVESQSERRLSLFSQTDQISMNSDTNTVLKSNPRSSKGFPSTPEVFPVSKHDRVSLEAWKDSLNHHRDFMKGDTWRRKYEEIETVL